MLTKGVPKMDNDRSLKADPFEGDTDSRLEKKLSSYTVTR
jgi:hypothetical protein